MHVAILLRDDVEVDVGSFGHEALDGEEVEILAQAVEGGAAEEGLRDALLGDVGGGGGGDAFAGELDDVGAEVFGELEAGFEGALALGGFVFVASGRGGRRARRRGLRRGGRRGR